MNKIVLTVMMICISCIAHGQEIAKEYWYAYLADYGGKPGSTMVDMVWFKKAPDKDFPYLLKIIVNSSRELIDGLPDSVELSRLHQLSDAAFVEISKNVTVVSVGTFAFQNKFSSYFYIKDTLQAVQLAEALLKKNYSADSALVEVKPDKAWQAYFEFLYPNDATMDYVEQHYGIKPLYRR